MMMFNGVLLSDEAEGILRALGMLIASLNSSQPERRHQEMLQALRDIPKSPPWDTFGLTR